MDLLASNNLNILKASAQDPNITDEVFNMVLDFSFKTLLRKDCDDAEKQISKVNSSNIKGIHAALVTLIVESAKNDLQDDQLDMLLDDCGFTSNMKEVFLSQFNYYCSDIRDHLNNIGFQNPHVVDLNWRLDYNIKNNHLHKVDELKYTISLAMSNSEQVEFTCSREELQDFSGKLKEAVKALERAT